MKQNLTKLFILLFSSIILNSCVRWYEPLDTVSNLDMTKFSGKWYLLAIYPKSISFQGKCISMDIEKLDKNKISLKYDYQTFDGKSQTVSMQGIPENEKNTGKYTIEIAGKPVHQFWITEISNDYSYAIAGNPDRDMFWLISRNSHITKSEYDEILKRAAKKMFDVRKTVVVSQTCE